MEQRKYRAGVIGLGWMGFLYDLGKRDYERIGGSYQTPIYDVESADRPLPDGLDVKRTFHLYDHPGQEGLATSYAAAFFDRPRSGIGGRGRPGSTAAGYVRGTLRH